VGKLRDYSNGEGEGAEEIATKKKLSLWKLRKKTEIFPFGCVTLISSPLVICRQN
jgi:hypothetical protein